MIEPLPNARSIWPSAASSAFCLSMGFQPNARVRTTCWGPLLSYAGQECNVKRMYCFRSHLPRVIGTKKSNEGRDFRFLVP